MGTVNMDELSEYHETLLETVKAQVKAIMEESVTKKFVHEESEHVLRLCATVQTCLLDRLRKRTAGFLRTNTIANLFNKVGKSIPEVTQLIVKIEETESAYENDLSCEGKWKNGTKPQATYLRQLKQIWVRLALTEKLLDKIVEYLVDNSSKYYEKSAILADPVHGKILSSLLVGPCALEYTKMKTSDHYWSDPPADELLQRHKLHSRNEPSSPSPLRRPALHSLSKYGSGDQAEKIVANGINGGSFREYVESLHQNSKSTLLYGKNNVVVQPREELHPIPGYLSLHQVADLLHIKWTPNQLMNGNDHKQNDETSAEEQNNELESTRPTLFTKLIGSKTNTRHNNPRHETSEKSKKPSSYWEYAISVNVCDIVYLHCHQRNDNGGTLVLVGQDGVQRPPICFPPGGHLLAFLTCLETGLLPHGHLDPPLWSQHGKGKVFPRLRNRSSYSSSSSAGSQSEAEEATDFVFRVTAGNSGMIYMTEAPEPGPLSDKAIVPPMPDYPDYANRILLILACDPTNDVLQNSDSHKKNYKKRSKRPPLIPRTLIMKQNIGCTPITYDKKLFMESTIAPPSTFPHLHFVVVPSQDGGPGPSYHVPSHPVHDVTTQDLPVSIENAPIHDSFDAYSVSSGYSFYGSQESEYGVKNYSSRSSLKVLCDTMRRQIISRAFYGWLAHCRHLSTVRTHLSALVLPEPCLLPFKPLLPIDQQTWDGFLNNGKVQNPEDLMRRVYFGGIEHSLRETVWPFLLNHYPLKSSVTDRERIDSESKIAYESVIKEWINVEKVIKRREKDVLAANLAKLSTSSVTSSTSSFDAKYIPAMRKQSTVSDVFVSMENDPPQNGPFSEKSIQEEEVAVENHGKTNGVPDFFKNKRESLPEVMKKNHGLHSMQQASEHTPYSSISTEPTGFDRRLSNFTNASTSMDTFAISMEEDAKLDNILEAERENDPTACDTPPPSVRKTPPLQKQNGVERENSCDHVVDIESEESIQNGHGITETLQRVNLPNKQDQTEEADHSNFTTDLLDTFGLNLHRIEKDVHRCDRNHSYFTHTGNLNKLRNIMCSYVWRNLDTGYMQGMCDLAAPLLVVMDDESKVYSCFTHLMGRMGANFPNGGAMDQHFANMRSLLQILDSELFEHMHRNGDYTHFYFCYRWFLLDFKRELSYEDDVFSVWERIWAACHVCSEHFVLFFALAMLHNYRNIILDNEMDFTDIIKFFNEMAERHNAKEILQLAQNFVFEVQSLVSK